MRIALLSNSPIGFPVLECLMQQKVLCALASGRNNPQIVGPYRAAAAHARVAFDVLEEDFPTSLERWLLEARADAVIVAGFHRKIPASTLALPPLGFFNFHTGLLPQRRGPDPVFWSIRDQDESSGVTLHRMDADLDTGPIVLRRVLPVAPHETYGGLTGALLQEMPAMCAEWIAMLREERLVLEEQTPGSGAYQKRPEVIDLIIQWHAMSALAIKALVQATNPAFGGALAYLRGQELRVFQVSLAYPADPVHTPPRPGTIVSANPEGDLVVFVNSESLLRIDAVGTGQGIYTGGRLVSILDLKPGDRFYLPGQEAS